MNAAVDLLSSKSREIRRIKKSMEDATSYDEWVELAKAHDEVTGTAHWKNVDQTNLYDFNSIRTRIDKLRSLRANHDDHGLLFALNEGIHGNMGGMGKALLHNHAMLGTKKLIEDYVQEISMSLQLLADLDPKTISDEEKHDFFQRASHCYGRSALMLSGGGALGNFHLGVIKVLLEKDLLPVVISGSSAGAFIAAIVGTHSEEDLLGMYNDGSLLAAVSKGAGKFKFEISNGQTIGINEVEEGIARLVPDLTFQEAYEKTGRSINISISPAEPQQTSRLLNAIASPNVLIRSAVMASCSIPGVFPSVVLQAKNVHGEKQDYLPSRRWIDGTFSQDLPSKRLARIFGVNHFIVSQVNPHVLPLLTESTNNAGVKGAVSRFSRTMSKEMMRNSLNFIQRRMQLSTKAALTLNTLHAMIDQVYTGDINIFPPFKYMDPRKIVAASSREDIEALMLQGEQSTWHKVAAIQTNTLIGRTLDSILNQFEKKETHWLRSAPKTSKFREDS